MDYVAIRDRQRGKGRAGGRKRERRPGSSVGRASDSGSRRRIPPNHPDQEGDHTSRRVVTLNSPERAKIVKKKKRERKRRGRQEKETDTGREGNKERERKREYMSPACVCTTNVFLICSVVIFTLCYAQRDRRAPQV